MDTTASLPTWMTPERFSVREDDEGTMNSAGMLPVERKLEKNNFECVFEYALDRLAEGAFIGSIVKSAPIAVHRGRFMTWVKNDAERWRRYNAAQQVGAEIIASNLVDPTIDEERAIPQDANLMRVNFEKGKWYLSIVDRKRFAETKQVEINQSISITAALAQANGRLIEHEVVKQIEESEP